jgi:hypothetical protein
MKKAGKFFKVEKAPGKYISKDKMAKVKKYKRSFSLFACQKVFTTGNSLEQSSRYVYFRLYLGSGMTGNEVWRVDDSLALQERIT